ncbi:hypothetical protein JQS43_17020 [Natronosporangium hydrolyticum]|uniref:Uncharacterized protein n=1 Tax=Natronosporangium hydrolyticum TaxID=2811111 RepID=A0A895YD70_9ACTN|nr:hypothetical protein [Natronosporangium hydrolyticum]QSB13319.1 hypothetical protein JQS43_17020 [Natronosporangium hydrolyticum]
MSRGTPRRPLAGIRARFAVAVIATATVVATGVVATPALADGHDYATVSGDNLANPLTVTADDHPDHYATLRREVIWLFNREGDGSEPDPDELGPQYALQLFIAGEEQHRFELYPLAGGGPRVFRPADQPGDSDLDEAWFLARLSLPETLTELGIPLTDAPTNGGVAGEEPVATEEATGPLGFLDEWREGMLLTMALAVAVLAGLASVSLLLRRDR